MKTLLFGLALAGAGISTANAQVFVPQSVANGAVVGGIAGALIGGHNNDRWGEGAVIGAAIGALFGAAIDQPRAVDQGARYETTPYGYPVYTPAPIQPAPVVPAAPVYGEPVYSSQVPVYTTQQPVVQQQPSVIYVERPAPPQVIYVERPYYPRIVYIAPPIRISYPRHYVAPPRYRGNWRR